MADHAGFMHRCLDLAQRGQGEVGNGALVGAVLVREGGVVAEGWHEAFGKAHAERALLEKFEQKISSNDTLYVNLEPCCHHGKQPPCTDILLERGVKRVVYGMRDPDPRVAGKGMDVLRTNGVEVIGPVLPQLCARLNRGFVNARTKARPWITLKQARMPDGRIAEEDGTSLKITSPQQDAWAHRWLRATHDAILVGVSTIIADDPQLTVRFANDAPSVSAQPFRIILDAHRRLPVHAKVVTDDHRHRTIIVRAEAHEADRALEGRGVRVLHVPMIEREFVWQDLWDALMTPHNDYHGLTSILVEGGAKTWKSFRGGGMVDEEVTLVGKLRS